MSRVRQSLCRSPVCQVVQARYLLVPLSAQTGSKLAVPRIDLVAYERGCKALERNARISYERDPV